MCNVSVQIQMKIRKISRRRSRSTKHTELSNFTLLLYRGRQRNIQIFITHVHSYCSLFGAVLVADEIVVWSCMVERFEKFRLNFVVCNPCRSSPSFTILVPLRFIIIISLAFSYLSKVLFSGFCRWSK